MGVEVSTTPAVASAPEELRHRGGLVFVNMLDRERADFLPHAGLAEGRLSDPRRRHRDPRSAPSTTPAASFDLVDMKATSTQ